MRSITTVTVGALALLLLSGCAVAAPAEEESAAPGQTAAAPVDGPTVRVPLACEALVAPADLAAALGEGLEPVSPAFDTLPTLAQFANEQYGQLDCAWSTGPLSFAGNSPSLVVSVIPDVTPERWAEFLPAIDGEGVTAGAFEGDSYVSCSTGFSGSSCTLHTLLGGYWLSMDAYDSAQIDGDALEHFTPLLSPTVAAVQTAAAAPARWSAEGAGASAAPTGLVDAAALASALGAGDVEAVTCGPTTEAGAHWLAGVETGFATCVYSIAGLPDQESAYATIDYLPGGSWAWAATQQAAGDYAELDDLGPAALSFDSGDDTTTVAFTRGSDLVLLNLAPLDGEPVGADTAAAISAAVAELLP
jgi:hypothetical protein